MFIATLAVIIFVVVLALVVRKQNIENQKRVKELVFLSACGNEEAKRALEKANLSPQEYSQLLETALREKAENGSSVAARLLGTRFYTEGDFKQAYKWYRRAAEAGDLPAMHQLAEDRFAERCGMNPEESFKWKLYAANHGDGENMFYTAMSLATGVGVQKSIKEAVMWYERTCACKSAPIWCVTDAHGCLGIIYGACDSEFSDPAKWKIHYNALKQMLRSASKHRSADRYANAAYHLGCVCATSLARGTEATEQLKNKRRTAYLLTLAYEAQESQILADLALERLKELDYEIDDVTYRIWAEDARNLNVNMTAL